MTDPVKDAAGAPEIDVDQLPGGARAALEAVLMVIDEPASEIELATALSLPVDTVRALLLDLQCDYDGGASSGGLPAAAPSRFTPDIRLFGKSKINCFSNERSVE